MHAWLLLHPIRSITGSSTPPAPPDPAVGRGAGPEPSPEVAASGGEGGRRRSAFRQRLVTAERGIGTGLRADSSCSVHFFVTCLAVASGVVSGLTVFEWAVLVLSVTLLFAAELTHQALRMVQHSPEAESWPAVRRACGVASGASTLCLAGAGLSLVLLLVPHLARLFG